MFHDISGLGSLLWNIPSSTPALEIICWPSVGVALHVGAWNLELDLWLSYVLSVWPLQAASALSTSTFSIFKINHNPYQPHRVVVRITFDDAQKMVWKLSGAVETRENQTQDVCKILHFFFMDVFILLCSILWVLTHDFPLHRLLSENVFLEK